MGKINLKYCLLFLLIGFLVHSVSAIKPFYRFGTFNKSVENMTSEVTKTLVNHGFEVVGMFHPSQDDSLCVIVFTCDELTSMATGVGDKAAFGSTMRIGIIGDKHRSSLTMLNPHYFVNAFYNSKANSEEVEFMTSKIDSIALNAMSVFSHAPIKYGQNLSIEELHTYRFLPTMARFTDVIELGEFDEYLEAITVIRHNVMAGIGDAKLAYEICFEDKEIAVFGITFNNTLEKELLNFLGVEYLSSLPFEVLIQDNKAYMLSPKYRIPLYNPAISSFKLLKLMSFSSDFKDSLFDISE